MYETNHFLNYPEFHSVFRISILYFIYAVKNSFTIIFEIIGVFTVFFDPMFLFYYLIQTNHRALITPGFC